MAAGSLSRGLVTESQHGRARQLDHAKSIKGSGD